MKHTIAAFSLFLLLSLGLQAQTFTTIYTFPSESSGFGPTGTPYIDLHGLLYGTTSLGGVPHCNGSSLSCGLAFSLTPPVQPGGDWTETVLYDFQGGSDGSSPETGLIPQSDGTLIGTTVQGGLPSSNPCHYGCGTLFQLTPPAEPGASWTEHVLYDFPPPDRTAFGPLQATSGVLYGLVSSGGSQNCDFGCGSVYELLPPAQTGGAWSLMPIHQFPGGTQGEYPFGSLVSDANGVLYGVLQLGGVGGHPDCSDDTTGNCGAVFASCRPYRRGPSGPPEFCTVFMGARTEPFLQRD